MRVGLGIDAHRFAPGRKLVLGGVEIPHETGLAGHSDADVVLHALMDAMLGACGAGDIGEMFPDTDETYAGVASTELLGKVALEMESRGFKLVNADIVVVCEEPRLSKHREAIRARIAEVLGADPGSIAVKGTTTEGMGFTGRGEGIAAIATVLIE